MSGQDNGTGASGPNPQPGCFSLRAQSRYHRPAATPPPRRRRIPSSVGGKGQSHKQTQWKTRGAGKSDTRVSRSQLLSRSCEERAPWPVYPRPLAHLPYARRDGGPAAVAARGSKSSASRRWRSASVKPTSILVVIEGGSLVKVLLADFGEAKQLSLAR